MGVIQRFIDRNKEFANKFRHGDKAMPLPSTSPCSPAWTRASIPSRRSAARSATRT